MKFMHLSDVRLGMHMESGRPWDSQRQQEVEDNFRETVRTAEEKKVDVVLIAGGLFSHRPVTAELEQVNRIFAAHPGTAFVIIAGDSDRIRKTSPVLSFHWADNVYYCTEERGETVNFPTLSAAVYARSLTDGAVNSEGLITPDEDETQGEKKPAIRIALAAEPSLEKASGYSCSGFAYVALGGLPAFTELEKDRVCYSGGMEPAGMNDTGAHGYIIGEISPVTGSVTSLKFEPAASASYVPLLVKTNPSVTTQEFEQMIEKEIRQRGENNIYRIRIAGQTNPETEISLKNCRGKYRIADILDETEPVYDYEQLFREHQQDLIGYFISTLRKRGTELPELDRKAMFAGIDALLRTAEKEGERT